MFMGNWREGIDLSSQNMLLTCALLQFYGMFNDTAGDFMAD